MGIALDLDVGVEEASDMSNAESLVKSLTRVAVVVAEETLDTGKEVELARDPSEE